jgi:hypothetical protein
VRDSAVVSLTVVLALVAVGACAATQNATESREEPASPRSSCAGTRVAVVHNSNNNAPAEVWAYRSGSKGGYPSAANGATKLGVVTTDDQFALEPDMTRVVAAGVPVSDVQVRIVCEA